MADDHLSNDNDPLPREEAERLILLRDEALDLLSYYRKIDDIAVRRSILSVLTTVVAADGGLS